MTNAPPAPPPPLRPPLTQPMDSVYRLYTYAVGKLNQRAPHRVEAVLREISKEGTRRLQLRLDAMYEAAGIEEGPASFRRESYTLKTQMEAVEGLWFAQRSEFPKKYRKRVVDAYQLGALLPPWAEEDAIRFGARVK